MEAREITGWTIGDSELMRSIETDIPFFDQSGGGVTFSGGEPLCQPDFLLAMLEASARFDIHCAVDTSGYGEAAVLLKAAKLCNLFLYDLKVLDPQKHRASTGVDNRRVLDNLRMLSASGVNIVIRMPLIPTVNDSEEDIAAAARFIAGLPRTHPVHLLPYHRAANGKYLKLGISYRGENILPPLEEQVTRAAQRLSNFRLTVEVGG